MANKEANIYREQNYQVFRKLNGNRSVSEIRMRHIRDSINAVGYVLNPICVNENMEIIDGQGRFEVLKELHLPIDYYVAKGAGIDECIAMNINMSNWKLEDYIDCYADMGNTSYKYLKCLYDAYRCLGIGPILNACSYFQKVKTGHLSGGTQSTNIKNGSFTCSTELYESANKILSYELKFKDRISELKGGRKDLFYLAIGFAYKTTGIDHDRLVEKVNEARDLLPALNIFQALDELSRVYNYKFRGKKLYLSNDYERMLDEK